MDGHDAQLCQLAASVLQLQEAVRQAERRQAAAEEAQGQDRAALLQQLGTAQETISSQARCACMVGVDHEQMLGKEDGGQSSRARPDVAVSFCWTMTRNILYKHARRRR